MGFFSRGSQNQVGIDIGTSSVKAVELTQEGSAIKLANYGVVYGLDYLEHVSKNPTDHATFKMSEEEIAQTIKKTLSFAKIKTKEAIFSIPIFSSFLTTVQLPHMNIKELEQAVLLQAPSYIPAPLEEVVLDWIAIPPRKDAKKPAEPQNNSQKNQESKTVSQAQKEKEAALSSQLQSQNASGTDLSQNIATAIKESENKMGKQAGVSEQKLSILLVAIPKEVITRYERIAAAADIEVKAIESESFSMVRALAGNDSQSVMLIDLGSRSSTLTIVDRGFVRLSHTVVFSGKQLTSTIAKSLNISISRAEKIKREEGLSGSVNAGNMQNILQPSLQRLIGEYRKMADYYQKQEEAHIEKVILSGGSSRLPGLKEYLSSTLGVPTEYANPFADITHPKELDQMLANELSSHLTVALGAAMRDLKTS